jgi:hypothetical protein
VNTTLTLTWRQHQAVLKHLFPGDGREAVAFLLCGQARGLSRTRLVTRKVIPLPYEDCAVRAFDRVTWPTEWLVPLLNEAAANGYAVVKMHGHGDFASFSSIDDASDRALFPSVHAWCPHPAAHASAIMLQNGRVFGRTVADDASFQPLDCVNVVGSDLWFWYASDPASGETPAFALRVAQTFGRRTYESLRRLRIGVVGCSGTGSPVVEELARNCVGAMVLVDPDVVEHKNLNRIWNATLADAEAATPKVSIAERAIRGIGFGTEVRSLQKSLFDPESVTAIAGCDVVFGCVDSIDGRYLLNRLAAFYSIPYFDLGVKLEADGIGGVDQVCGTVHYLQPEGSSLLSRHLFTMEQVRAAGLRRTDPDGYQRLLSDGYIRGAAEDRPAVIQLNTLIASLAVNEFLARIHPYRIDSNSEFAIQRISLSHAIFEHQGDGESCEVFSRHVGRGDVIPPLDLPELSIA